MNIAFIVSNYDCFKQSIPYLKNIDSDCKIFYIVVDPNLEVDPRVAINNKNIRLVRNLRHILQQSYAQNIVPSLKKLDDFIERETISTLVLFNTAIVYERLMLAIASKTDLKTFFMNMTERSVAESEEMHLLASRNKFHICQTSTRVLLFMRLKYPNLSQSLFLEEDYTCNKKAVLESIVGSAFIIGIALIHIVTVNLEKIINVEKTLKLSQPNILIFSDDYPSNCINEAIKILLNIKGYDIKVLLSGNLISFLDMQLFNEYFNKSIFHNITNYVELIEISKDIVFVGDNINTIPVASCDNKFKSLIGYINDSIEIDKTWHDVDSEDEAEKGVSTHSHLLAGK